MINKTKRESEYIWGEAKRRSKWAPIATTCRVVLVRNVYLQIHNEWKVDLGQNLFLRVDMLHLLEPHYLELFEHLHGIKDLVVSELWEIDAPKCSSAYMGSMGMHGGIQTKRKQGGVSKDRWDWERDTWCIAAKGYFFLLCVALHVCCFGFQPLSLFCHCREWTKNGRSEVQLSFFFVLAFLIFISRWKCSSMTCHPHTYGAFFFTNWIREQHEHKANPASPFVLCLLFGSDHHPNQPQPTPKTHKKDTTDAWNDAPFFSIFTAKSKMKEKKIIFVLRKNKQKNRSLIFLVLLLGNS